MGQLVRDFGDTLLLTTGDLEEFVKDRNLIIHNYWRLTKANVHDVQGVPEAIETTWTGRCRQPALVSSLNPRRDR